MLVRLRSALPYILLLVLSLLVLDLANPLFDKPARDGGFFLYAGSQILQGKIPYIDFWDSKGPAIFYINALGLLMGNGSRWGVWFVELIFVFGTLLVLYRSLSKRWGLGAALFGVTMAALGLQVALGLGNYTEEYALLFNAIGLYIFLSTDTEKNYSQYLWIGALFGLSFTFRANNIGGLIAILLAVSVFYLFKRNYLETLKIDLALMAGFIVPLLLWTLIFAVLHGAGDMIYASILFNFSYSTAQQRDWLELFSGFGHYGMSWYGWFTLLAWFILVLRALSSFVQRKLSVLESFLLFWFPIEIVLSNLSGRNFTHYYISWALSLAVYSAFAFSEFWQLTFKVSSLEGWSKTLGASFAGVLTIGVLILSPSSLTRYGKTMSQLVNKPEAMTYVDSVAAYIQQNTQPNDLVLTWYPDMGLNFMAGRSSPVKYLYYPLFLEGSLTKEIESSYISELKTHMPELILDCSRSVDAIPSLDSATREAQYSTPGLKRKMYIQPGMDDIFAFIAKHYHIDKTLEGCLVFRVNTN